MALSWYVKRLANMSPAEVLHRFNEVRRKRQSKKRAYGWSAFQSKSVLERPPALADLLTKGCQPSLANAVRASATNLLNGAFSAHGVAWPNRDPTDLFPASLWRLDPVTGKAWPGAEHFCFDIPYRHERVLGDVKYVWDLNRLQFLQPLAAAAVLGEARAIAAIEAAIDSWTAANPPFQGIAWNSGIELALRAVSVAIVIALVGDRLERATLDKTESLLRAHHFWLKRYPSRYSSANNHLVAEALGEFVIEAMLPDLRPGSQSRAILERELLLQILPDGTGAEQSPTYAAFTVEMLLVADLFARTNGEPPLSAAARDRLAAFADWIAWMADDQGRVPNIGDDDEGRVLSLSDSREFVYPSSIARAVVGLFDLAVAVPASADKPELRDAFFGSRSSQSQLSGMKTFDFGGYTVVREVRAGRNVRFMIDHGPLGYLSIAAHGHADANAITLSLDNEDIFVDPGTFLYHSGGAWRDWFRGTAAHNTLCLDGADQSTIAGPFNWSTKANARLISSASGKDWSILTEHDGYVSRYGVHHRRAVSTTPHGFDIVDRLEGRPVERPIAITFQTAPGLSVRAESSRWVVLKDETKLAWLDFSQPGEVTLSNGGDIGTGGWYSPCFGTKQAADCLVWHGPMPPEGLTTSVRWG